MFYRAVHLSYFFKTVITGGNLYNFCRLAGLPTVLPCFLSKSYVKGVAGGGFFASCNCRETEKAMWIGLGYFLEINLVPFFLQLILLSKHFSDGFGIFYDFYAVMVRWAQNNRTWQCSHESYHIRVFNYLYALSLCMK